jgi:glycosyltransferase involved in cell wall biosynthesis
MNDVAILIPTLRRPAELERALRSVFAQARVADRIREIVVVDNAPEAPVRELVGRLQADAPWPLVYVHEARPGVATARNAGLRATAAPLIAFLDDDEEATPGWLVALLDVQATTGADAVFGVIAGRAPSAKPWLREYLETFFSREGPERSGLIDRAYGCGNALLVRSTALPGAAPFDSAADQTGGEDDALFAALKARDGRFAWSAEALVFEHAPAHRATLGYALRRAFAYGQGPSQTAWKARDYPALARWVAVGAAQALVYGVTALVMCMTFHPRRTHMLDRAVRGVGKLVFVDGLEPKLYGAAALDRSTATAAAAGPAPVSARG